MTKLRDVALWRHRLGFLPVPLYSNSSDGRFVLLNGARGNFCLDVAKAPQDEDGRRIAWSADVDHYVTVADKVSVQRWDRRGVETYRIEDVEPHLDRFQEYLESKSAPRNRSVVAHAMRMYRTLRARVDPNADGYTALLAFLAVLSDASARQNSRLGVAEGWSEAAEAQRSLTAILKPVDVDELVQLLLDESLDGNSPDMDLVIRHAAGRIFQEAHYLAFVDPQSDLFDAKQALPTRASGAIGTFFTPTPLVRAVVEQALTEVPLGELSEVRIFDPACGSGEFLREAIRQLEIRRYTGTVTAIGFDISRAACSMARFILSAEQARWNHRLRYTIEQRDSLDGQPWPIDVHCCLMNPPFVSWRGMSEDQKAAVELILGNLSALRPDMASAFLVLAQRCLGKVGVLGAVLPASLLDGDSAQKLRASLEQRFDLRLLARLGSQQIFADALVDPGLIVARNRELATEPHTRRSTTLVWADHIPESSEKALRTLRKLGVQTVVGEAQGSTHYSVYSVTRISEVLDNWAPRSYDAVSLLKQARRFPRVGDFFSVQQGALTGLNSAFLLNSHELASLTKAERAYFRPAIISDSVSQGFLSTSIWVFYPYTPGLPPLDKEQQVAALLPRYYERWLKPNKRTLSERSGRGSGGWWGLTRPRSWQMQPRPKIVSTYFGGAGSFAWDEMGRHIVVQGYGWEPKKSDLGEQKILALIAYLTSSVTDRFLAGVSNNLAGGQWNLSKRFVERMPLLDVHALPPDILIELSNYGRTIVDGQLENPSSLDVAVENVVKLMIVTPNA